MPAARPTEAAIARACKAARRAGGGVVEIRDGTIRIIVTEAAPDVASGQTAEDEWDSKLGARA